MSNKLFKNRYVLAFSLACSAWVLSPIGSSQVKAATLIAQPSIGSLKGQVVDEKGEPIIVAGGRDFDNYEFLKVAENKIQ